MSAHTPAPWLLDASVSVDCIYSDDATGSVVARVGGKGFEYAPRSDDERLANARLIAAAPDLLAACKSQHEALDRLFAMLIEAKPGFFPSESGQPWAAVLRGNVAIAKAEGRS